MRKGATHLKTVMIEITPSALQQKNNHKTLRSAAPLQPKKNKNYLEQKKRLEIYPSAFAFMVSIITH